MTDWFKTSKKLKSGAINSFANGLRREGNEAEECIKRNVSDGRTKGTVGTIKVTRRSLYGRYGVEFFRLKVLAKERIRRARQARI